jgi:hypothetical protein
VTVATTDVVDRLLDSDEPSVRLKVRRDLLGEVVDVEEVRRSARVRALLSEREEDGKIPRHPYTKWTGAFWVLALLAELSYPAGDRSLLPLRDQVYGWLLSDYHDKRWTRRVNGLARIHATQEGYAIWSLLMLGLADEGVDRLVARLLETQWPDGGWNCDPRASGRTSAFAETHLALRALALYARTTRDDSARDAAARAAEVFLCRHLFRRRSTGEVTQPWHVELHFPCYWNYDVLFGLKVMHESGFLGDPRCEDALDLLESKRLAKGGWPAEGRYYGNSRTPAKRTLVDWGGANKRSHNEWVTVDAISVLHAAGRLKRRRP